MALVQTTTGTSASSTTSIATSAFGSNTTTGNTIVVATIAADTSQAILSVSDGTNTYSLIKQMSTANTGIDVEFWRASNITGLTTPTITATYTGTVTACDAAIMAREYTSFTSSPLDQSASGNGVSGTPSSGATATTTQASEIVIGMVGTNDSTAETVGSGFGNFQSAGIGTVNIAMEDKTVSSTGAQTAVFGTADTDWAAAVGTFKLTGGGTTAHNLTTLGVGQ